MTTRRRHRLAGVPVEGFRVPSGHVCITLDIAGINPVSICIPVTRLDQLLSGLNKKACDRPVGQDPVRYAELCLGTIEMFKQGGTAARETAATIALWLALNHPVWGSLTKNKVSEAIRQTNRSHITMAVDRQGHIATAVADRFVDLDAMLALADRANLTHPVIVTTTGDETVTH